jgi:hypothetical protein
MMNEQSVALRHKLKNNPNQGDCSKTSIPKACGQTKENVPTLYPVAFWHR